MAGQTTPRAASPKRPTTAGDHAGAAAPRDGQTGAAETSPAEPAVSTRDRIVFATAELFRRQGYTATGMKQISTEAGAPFGSLYHFFPGGKEQLGEEVVRRAGAFWLLLWPVFYDGKTDLVTATEAFFAGAAQTLRDTDYEDACPIATVALEVASTSEPLRIATADAFTSWIDQAAASYEDAGIAPADAYDLAVSVLALLEGAFLFGRAMRDAAPMEAAGKTAAAAVRAALAGR